MKIELSSYIQKIGKLYEDARKDYTEWYDNFIADDNRKLDELEKHKKDYSSEGYAKRKTAILEERQEHSNKLDGICQRFNNSVAKLRQACKDDFKDAYGVSPKLLDMAAVELVKSGILTENELLEMAQEEYSDNGTMLRYIGTELQKSEDPTIRQKGIALANQSKNNPHLSIFDDTAAICNAGMRSAHYDGIGQLIDVDEAKRLSDNYAENRYQSAYSQLLAQAQKYTVERSD